MIPLVALVGRPNVGKSTLFNRLAGKKLAIVHDEPGVTRDRHYADTHLQGRNLTLIDTGGFDPEDVDPMRQGIARHVEGAIGEADVIVCVLDALTPPTEADRAAVDLLRRSSKPVVYFANRADNQAFELQAQELHRLGIDPLICGSALHGRSIAQLEAAMVDRLPAIEKQEEDEEDGSGRIPRIALLGRPNAGKSSLLNALSGQERSLVDNRPGTTRDPIDAHLCFKGKDYVFVDTAGIRRKAKVHHAVESASVMRSIRCIGRADIVVLMCDANEEVAEQDARLLSLAVERGRAVIVGLNKMDLIEESQRKSAEEQARDIIHFASWVPFIRMSAKTHTGLGKLMHAIDRAHIEFSRRVTTSELNRFFDEVLERRPPPTKGGKAPRLYYVTQAETRPPVFVAMCNLPESLQESYRRFVINQLRDAFGFQAVPVKVRYRPRRRREREDG